MSKSPSKTKAKTTTPSKSEPVVNVQRTTKNPLEDSDEEEAMDQVSVTNAVGDGIEDGQHEDNAPEPVEEVVVKHQPEPHLDPHPEPEPEPEREPEPKVE